MNSSFLRGGGGGGGACSLNRQIFYSFVSGTGQIATAIFKTIFAILLDVKYSPVTLRGC